MTSETAATERGAVAERSFAMLLSPADLPGGEWRIVEERSWPTGPPGAQPSAVAEPKAGDGDRPTTAWRKMARSTGDLRAWAEVVPYGSVDDAETSLRGIDRYFVGANAEVGEILVFEQVVTDRVVPGMKDTWIFEKSTTGPGGDNLARYVAGIVGSLVSIVCVTRSDEMWPWPEVIDLATAQAERARRALGGDAVRRPGS